MESAPREPAETDAATANGAEVSVEGNTPDSSTAGDTMQEFYQLSQELLWGSLILTAVIFAVVWATYSLNIALNYALGAIVGTVYLRMLSRDVAQLGVSKGKLSKTRLALLVAVIIIASRVDRLQVLPIFLGFLTYKGSLLLYVLRTVLPLRP